MLAWPNLEPDRSLYAVDAAQNIKNVLPIRDGWAPLADLVPFSQALGAEALGGWSCRKSTDGTFRLVVATRNSIFELNAADYSWTNISGPSAPYNVPVGDSWSAAKYGQRLVLCNINDNIQYLDIDSGLAFADLPGSPPKARYLATIGEYLALGYLAGKPNRAMLSGFRNIGFWTVGQRGCDFQDFANGEEIMNIQGGERGGIIAHRQAFTSIALTSGGDYSFTTALINPSRGVIAPQSVVTIGPGAFLYLAQDGFFMNVEGQPIGAGRVDKFFTDRVDPLYISQVLGAADPFQKIAWFQGQDITGTKFLLGYHWQLDRWCFADNNVSRMCVMATPGVTWDGADVLFANWDAANIPWDSALLTGGALRFAAFDTSNRLCFFTGTPRAATLETPDVQLVPGRRSFLKEMRVVTNASTYTLKAITSDYHGGTRTVGAAVSPFPRTGKCHFRSPSLLHAFRMEIPAGTAWTHTTGLDDIDAEPEGEA